MVLKSDISGVVLANFFLYLCLFFCQTYALLGLLSAVKPLFEPFTAFSLLQESLELLITSFVVLSTMRLRACMAVALACC